MDAGKLPKVAVLEDYRMFLTHPQVMVYIRKIDDITTPYAVAEFGFTFMRMVFIIPKSNKDKIEFTDENEYKIYWTFFNHYSSVPNWKFTKLDDKVARKITMNLNFEERKTE
jgi:hypothetical protein